MIDTQADIFGVNPASEKSMPTRSGNIEIVSIHEQLENLGTPVESISLGVFDQIGEFTAKKQRSPDSENYSKFGAFFRPNYERGMLISALIKKYKISSYLEIGFGRGYSSICAAMAMRNTGIDGKVTTIDPNFDQEHLQNLAKIFPHDWLRLIEFHQKTSDDYFDELDDSETFDMIYVDGDHRYEAVLRDWNNCKDRAEKVILLDDYHLPSKKQKDMDVSNVVDSIVEFDKKLVKMDRRIFFDDRLISYEDLDYGQVLIIKD